jgi:hypothetical protein
MRVSSVLSSCMTEETQWWCNTAAWMTEHTLTECLNVWIMEPLFTCRTTRLATSTCALRFRIFSQCKHTPCVIRRKQTHVPRTTHLQLHLPVRVLVFEPCAETEEVTGKRKNPRELPISQLAGCLWALSASRMLSTHLPTATWNTIMVQ